jgi:hypothetical protein
MLLKLTDAQLDTVYNAAGPLHADDRGAFLERVAEMLTGHEIGDGSVGRAVALAQERYFRPPDLSKARDQSKYR